MTFAQAVKQELRNTFGPQWVSAAVMWTVIALGFVMVFSIGSSVLDLAHSVASDIQGIDQ